MASMQELNLTLGRITMHGLASGSYDMSVATHAIKYVVSLAHSLTNPAQH